MGNWGVSKNATPKEKLKSEMADFLGGLNSCGEINYSSYSEIFDFSMDLLDKMYELGKSESKNINIIQEHCSVLESIDQSFQEIREFKEGKRQFKTLKESKKLWSKNNCKNSLELAIQIATIAHNGQVDKANQPYILHPLRVMFSLETDKEKIVGMLHDVIEDTNVTYQYLKYNGFDDEILDAIKSITRDSNETYSEFINRVKSNPLGTKVKLADLKDNMDISRIPNPTEKDYQRIKKYKKAKEQLLNKV